MSLTLFKVRIRTAKVVQSIAFRHTALGLSLAFMFGIVFKGHAQTVVEARAGLTFNVPSWDQADHWLLGYHLSGAVAFDKESWSFLSGVFYERRGTGSRSSFFSVGEANTVSRIQHYAGFLGAVRYHLGKKYRVGGGMEPSILAGARVRASGSSRSYGEVSQRFDLSGSVVLEKVLGSGASLQLGYRFNILPSKQILINPADSTEVEVLLKNQSIRLSFIQPFKI